MQGVFFRKHAFEKAYELGISGFVRNCDDGTVEVFAEGDEDALQSFVEWCRHGPRNAKVERVDMHDQPLKNFRGFVISR